MKFIDWLSKKLPDQMRLTWITASFTSKLKNNPLSSDYFVITSPFFYKVRGQHWPISWNSVSVVGTTKLDVKTNPIPFVNNHNLVGFTQFITEQLQLLLFLVNVIWVVRKVEEVGGGGGSEGCCGQRSKSHDPRARRLPGRRKGGGGSPFIIFTPT